jgi:hypothetical protein
LAPGRSRHAGKRKKRVFPHDTELLYSRTSPLPELKIPKKQAIAVLKGRMDAITELTRKQYEIG